MRLNVFMVQVKKGSNLGAHKSATSSQKAPLERSSQPFKNSFYGLSDSLRFCFRFALWLRQHKNVSFPDEVCPLSQPHLRWALYLEMELYCFSQPVVSLLLLVFCVLSEIKKFPFEIYFNRKLGVIPFLFGVIKKKVN